MVTLNENEQPADRDLEEAIAAELARFGDARHELAHWVMTGLPDNINLDPRPLEPAEPDETARRALAAAVAAADPIVEWRMGRMIARERPYVEVTPEAVQAMTGIWMLHDWVWPPDERIDEMLAAAGVTDTEHLRALLSDGAFTHGQRPAGEAMRRRPRFSRLVHDNADLVAELLMGPPGEVELLADALMTASPDALGPLAGPIVGLMTASSKQRQVAGMRLAGVADYDDLVPHLQRTVTEGTPAERAAAITAWGTLADGKHRGEVLEFCDAHCHSDRAAGVRKAIDALEQLEQQMVADSGDSSAAASDTSGPQAWPAQDDREPTADEVAALAELVEETYQSELAFAAWLRERREASAAAAGPAAPVDEPQRVSADVVDRVWTFLRSGGDPASFDGDIRNLRLSGPALGRLRPVFVFRLLQLVNSQGGWGPTSSMVTMIGSLAEHYRETGTPTLVEIQAGAEQAGYQRSDVVNVLPFRQPWSREDIAEWALAVLPELITALDGDPKRTPRFYKALAVLPEMPTRARHVLLSQAVGTHRAQRALAQRALGNVANLVDDVIDQLSSSKFGEREAAAIWLGDLAAVEAIPALHRAAAKETNDVALGAELSTLERLGESIDPYVDPDALMATAVKDLRKPMPAAGAWIPIDDLGELRWADGSAVDRVLVEWLVTQAVRMKSPAPSPIVRRLFGRMEPDGATVFADDLLARWIAEDTSEQYGTSAIGSKGLLSLVAAGGGRDVVAVTEHYVRQWYGYRAAQAKALIEMVAWIDNPAATQFVLSVGNRFRTKGIQAEALHQAELLAERKGWTLDELGLRTVPDGGFDSDGRLTLDYGPRSFTAGVGDDLGVVLSDEDGTSIKALPAPRASDDEAAVIAAKQQFAAAKKTVTTVAAQQPLRLRDAMCLQRGLPVDDFERYVLRHPLMGRLATRLVWAAESNGGRALFRPLTDGTLIDVADEQVEIADADRVVLAHELIDGVDVGPAWAAHFADYEVTPLFPQFGRPSLPDIADTRTAAEMEMTDWRGAIINDRQLRSVVKTVGFQLDSGADGGFVESIRRPVPSANLEVRVGVAGLHATTQDTDVALQTLRFISTAEYDQIPIGEIPPVLLVETIGDVERIVAAGDGIDPDWESRIGW